METEITIQCFDDLSSLKHKLEQDNWIFSNSFQLNDWYFSSKTNNELKAMPYIEKISNSFLIRQIIENDFSLTQLCYKTKELDSDGNVISEQKIKTNLDNLDNALKVFNSAKLNMWCSLENTSYVYTKNNLEIAIQVIKDLGIFIEFEEYEQIKNLSSLEKFENLKNMIKGTTLNLGEDFSCKKVLMKFNKQL